MKQILATIYSAYVGLLFFICLTILLILYVPLLIIRNDRIRMNIIYVLNRIFLRYIWSTLSGIWIRIEGKNKIDPDKTYAFVCNHSNMLDIPFSACCIDHYYKPLVKKELLSFPIMGPMLRMTSLGVDRANAESRRKTAEKMVKSMRNGLSLLVFPEGTRNRTPQPTKEFFDGAFRAAIAAQADIAPFVYINMRGLQPVASTVVYPGFVTVRFLDTISTVGMTEADTNTLKARVRGMIDEVLLREDSMFKGKTLAA